MSRRPTVSRETVADLLRTEMSYARIAVAVGCSPTTVYKIAGELSLRRGHRRPDRSSWVRPSYPPPIVLDGVPYTRGKNGRLYRRSFDWDRALDLYAEGQTFDEIAAAMGVTSCAIARIADPEKKERDYAASLRYTKSGVCEGCGKDGITGEAHRASAARSQSDVRSWDGRVLCVACRGKTRRKKLRLGADQVLRLECGHCREWKPIEEFSPRVRLRLTSGEPVRNARCRGCETAARQDYRERRKVPCVRCGAACLPASEKGPRGRDTGLCRDCYISSVTEAAA